MLLNIKFQGRWRSQIWDDRANAGDIRERERTQFWLRGERKNGWLHLFFRRHFLDFAYLNLRSSLLLRHFHAQNRGCVDLYLVEWHTVIEYSKLGDGWILNLAKNSWGLRESDVWLHAHFSLSSTYFGKIDDVKVYVHYQHKPYWSSVPRYSWVRKTWKCL